MAPDLGLLCLQMHNADPRVGGGVSVAELKGEAAGLSSCAGRGGSQRRRSWEVWVRTGEPGRRCVGGQREEMEGMEWSTVGSRGYSG